MKLAEKMVLNTQIHTHTMNPQDGRVETPGANFLTGIPKLQLFTAYLSIKTTRTHQKVYYN